MFINNSKSRLRRVSQRPATPALGHYGRQAVQCRMQNAKCKIQNEADAQKKIKNRTAEFAEKGRRVGGGLKNGDLLIASKVRSIHFTDDDAATPQIVP
ncbi:MAG: hypothetical protein E7136_05420 [Rikenellaceae bacterium]|nr:hypothetical protein [Rikenellaceae bacterium]